MISWLDSYFRQLIFESMLYRFVPRAIGDQRSNTSKEQGDVDLIRQD